MPAGSLPTMPPAAFLNQAPTYPHPLLQSQQFSMTSPTAAMHAFQTHPQSLLGQSHLYAGQNAASLGGMLPFATPGPSQQQAQALLLQQQ